MKKRTEPLGECSIENCTRAAKYAKTNWCQTHYHRWWRTGDPLGVKQEHGASGEECVNWRGDQIAYRTAHQRVQKAKGRAVQHDCAQCGGQAEQWAYSGDDPDEMFEVITNAMYGTRNVAYSTKVEHYQPLCRRCHLRHDRKGGWPKKTHCVHGHEYTEANTYNHPRGHQACRECARLRAARARRVLGGEYKNSPSP